MEDAMEVVLADAGWPRARRYPRSLYREAAEEWENKLNMLVCRIGTKPSSSFQNEVYPLIGFFSVFQILLFTAIAQSSWLRHRPLGLWTTKAATVGLLTSKLDMKKEKFRNFLCESGVYKRIGFLSVLLGVLLTAMAQSLSSRHAPEEGGMRDEALDSKDELLSRFAPSFKKHIEDALEPILGPVVSVLQSYGEAERKQRVTFLALEEKKLALRSEKIHLQRRRGGRCQLRKRASFPKSSRLRIRRGLRL